MHLCIRIQNEFKRPRLNTIFKYIKDTIFFPIMLFKVFENRLSLSHTPENLFKTGHRFLCLMDEKNKEKKVELPTIYFNHFV